MADNITVTDGNPIKVAGTCDESVVITADFRAVQKVLWVGATAAGQKVNITNTAGKTLFPFASHLPGQGALLTYQYDFPVTPHPCYGLKVDDMDAGTVYIYTVSRID